jgi:hypothetical protein
MDLIPVVVIVYFGIVLYDMLAQGSSPAAAAFWPLQSLSKVFAWLSKVDPNAATKSDLTSVSQQIANQNAAWQQQFNALQTAISVATGGKVPLPPAPAPAPAPTPAPAPASTT